MPGSLSKVLHSARDFLLGELPTGSNEQRCDGSTGEEEEDSPWMDGCRKGEGEGDSDQRRNGEWMERLGSPAVRVAEDRNAMPHLIPKHQKRRGTKNRSLGEEEEEEESTKKKTKKIVQ